MFTNEISFCPKAFFILFVIFQCNTVNAQSIDFSKSNPSLGVNTLLLWRHSSEKEAPDSELANGPQLQEIEIQLGANVDPYWRAQAVLAIHSEVEENSDHRHFELHPEEVYLESLSLPRVTLKIGKFLAEFGKHNTLHRHTFPFIDAPLVHQKVFGEEGLNEAGVSLSALLPSSWFSEVTGQYLAGENELLFASPTKDDGTGIIHWRNLWDLSDESTFDVTLSAARGGNYLKGATWIYDVSTTLKWRPIKSSNERSLNWVTEFLSADRQNFEYGRIGGVSTWVQWQLKRRWWVQGRFDLLGLPAANSLRLDSEGNEVDETRRTRTSLLIGFIPTEFSSIRLQYSQLQSRFQPMRIDTVQLQINASIGPHPAHNY